MSFIASAIIVGSATIANGIAQRKAAKRASKKARIQANKDSIAARKSEIFAETEGEGTGSIGKVSLAVEGDVLEKIKLARAGKTSVSI